MLYKLAADALSVRFGFASRPSQFATTIYATAARYELFATTIMCYCNRLGNLPDASRGRLCTAVDRVYVYSLFLIFVAA